jgi:hypothetical protein
MHLQNETLIIIEKIKTHYQKYFLPHFSSYINNQIVFIRKYNELLDIYKKRIDSRTEPDEVFINDLMLSYHRKTHELISTKYEKISKQNFDSDLAKFVTEINSYLTTIDENIIRVQDEVRFLPNEKDSQKIKFFKKVKTFFYSLSQFPIWFINIFRKIFRKPARKNKQWFHKIPLRNLTAFYLRDTVSLNFLSEIEEINKSFSAAFLEIWKSDEELSRLSTNKKIGPDFGISKRIEELERLPEHLTGFFDSIFSKTAFSYEDAYSKVGTIELSSKKLSTRKIEKKRDDLNSKYESLYNGWGNTFFALFEDWRLNKELYTLSEKLKHDFLELTIKTNEKLGENISPYLEEIKEFLEEVINKFKEFSGSSAEVKSLLYRERDRIYNKLSLHNIPEVSELILAQNVPDLIDQMEFFVNNGIRGLPEKRAIVKSTSYNEKIKDSEIDYLSPKEIITYSTLSSYIKASSLIKNSIVRELDEIQKGLKDIDRIADFNLESALSMFDAEINSFEDPLDIAIEGVTRAITKENESIKKLNDIKLKINTDLREAIEKVNNELIKLTLNENIIEIKLKIARAKAIQRTKELKQKSIHFIKNFFPIVINGINKGFEYLRYLYRTTRQKFGLEPHLVSVSTEISDFLAATENAISRLPFVYQRLFRIEPLDDERFFEGRDKELSGLNAAYENWKLKRYAPVIIYGEKGSGMTTLLNFYFKKLETNYNIVRTLLITNIYNENDFIDFLKSTFSKSTFNSIDEAAKYLNEIVTKQIVVIENMQNLFLRKVNGFICLKMLFELISKTNQNIFWIISSSLYAWEYLSKVMNVSDYFGYQIKLEKLNDEQMINIIIKRHRISGYNIYFEPADSTVIKKKSKKLSDAEIQEYLKKEYFFELNDFAKSNISLALLYWMRSTKEVTTDSIKLGSVVDHDFSFLNAMGPEKLFILYLLLLHDGLSEGDVMKIYNKSLDEIRLNLLTLLDDGIIIKKKDLYLINPLLYRQIVYLLQLKNIIH